MIRSIGTTPFRYVLVSERELPAEQQTAFWIVARTVEQVNAETAIGLRTMFGGKKGQQESEEKAAKKQTDREAKVFGEAVKKVENVIVEKDAPRGFFDKYHEKFGAAEDASEIIIKETEDANIIEDLFYVLQSDVTTEVLGAANKNSRLSSDEKN